MSKKMKDESWFEEEYFCYECGTKMEKADDEVVVCPKCKHSVGIEDYLIEEEIYEDFYYGDYENPHCTGCDGPWPVCTTSCKLFREPINKIN